MNIASIRRQLRFSIFSLMIAGALALVAVPSHAQFGSSLTGTVADSTGGAIPNAKVVITNEATHQSVTHMTSASGVYQFESLEGGKYDVSVTATGFKVGTYTAVAVTEGLPRNFDVALAIGGNSDTVTVNAENTIALQSSDGSVSTVISSEQLEKVPTYGRDPYNLLRTTPGITGDGARGSSGNAVFLPNSVGPGGSNFGIAQAENTVQISADGQRISDNNFLIDGVSVNSLGYGGAAVVTPNIEAIGSINVTSTSFSAEDGRNTGAQIHVVTKSGTNKIHGGANFQYDEPGLNAYNKYGGPSGEPVARVQTKNRDVAGSIGGPLLRDKLFGFFSFEHFNLTNVGYSSQYIDTPQFRALVHTDRPGSIADQIANATGTTPRVHAVLDQSCTSPQNIGTVGTQCNVVAGGIDIGSPYGTDGEYVPSALSQIGAGLDGIPDVEYVQVEAPGASSGKQFNGRVDYFLTPKDQLAASFYVTKLDNATQGSQTRPNQDVLFNPLNTAATFIYIHSFSPNLLNEFRANFTRFYENGVQDGIQGGSDFGIPYINVQNNNFDGTNDIQYGIGFATTTPAIFAENTYELRDTVTKVFGAHTIKFGFEGRTEQDNTNQIGGSRPGYSIAGLWNFVNSTPIYEEIYANPATGGPGNSARYLHDQYYGAFIQHNWKVTKEFTFNAGLRWEYFGPLYNSTFKINYPVLGPAGSELSGGALLPRHYLYNAQFGNFSPKFDFAYSPEALHSKTVLRGGFAMAYNRLNDVLFDPAIEDGPGIFNYGICCGTSDSPFDGGQITYGLGSSNAPNSYASNPALKTPINANGLPANGVTVEAYGADPNLKNSYSFLYALEVQQDLGRQFVLGVGYQGSTGRHYTRLVNENFLYNNNNSPFYALYIAKSDSNMYYNALNVHGTKRYANGISLDATYTWSKQEDQISNGDGADASGNQTYPQDNSTELGPGDFDVKHRVVATGTYDLHPYHGGSEVMKALVNGFEVNGIFTAHTGFPWTPVTYAINGEPTAANTGTISPVRPTSFDGHYSPTCDAQAFRNGTIVSGVYGLGYRKVTDAAGDTVNTDASGNPVSGYRPGVGRNSLRGPCYEQIDAGIAKDFKLKWLGEGGGLRIQVQAFNVFNKLNYSPFTSNTSSTQIDGGSKEVTSCPAGSPVGTVCQATATIVPGQAIFQKPQSASAGRVVELNARIRF